MRTRGMDGVVILAVILVAPGFAPQCLVVQITNMPPSPPVVRILSWQNENAATSPKVP